jgi:lysophospholipase L1-like esterase
MIKKSLFIVISLLLLVIIVELLAFTIFKIAKTTDNKIKYSFYQNNFHPVLGWVPKKSDEQILWNTNVNTNASGFRVNRSKEIKTNETLPILAIGDSFTFGAEVPNEHTWPAFLESKMGTKVINAGVNGYGLDQMYLNLKRLLENREQQYSMVILSFIFDDVHRTIQSHRDGMNKPVFRLKNNDLILTLPEKPTQSEFMIAVKDALMKTKIISQFTEKLLNPLFSEQTTTYISYTDGDPFKISSKLLLKILELSKKHDIPIFILGMNEQYNNSPIRRKFDQLIDLVAKNTNPKFSLVTNRNLLEDMGYQNSNKNLYISTHYWHGHLNFRGNDYIANTIYKFLSKNEQKEKKNEM